MKQVWRLKWMVMVLAVCLLAPLGSCGDDDDDDDNGGAPYIGTWERMESEVPGEEMKQVLVITATTFQVKMQMQLLQQWVDFMVIEGTYTQNGDMWTLTITRVGVMKDDLSGLEYYTSDDAEWQAILDDEVEMPESFNAKYTIDGDKLTVIFDDNGDGTYDPVEEGVVFTKA